MPLPSKSSPVSTHAVVAVGVSHVAAARFASTAGGTEMTAFAFRELPIVDDASQVTANSDRAAALGEVATILNRRDAATLVIPGHLALAKTIKLPVVASAQRNLLELSEMVPDDPAVKRLLKDIEEDLAAEDARLNSQPVNKPRAASAEQIHTVPAATDPFEPLPLLPDSAAELGALEAEIEAAAAEEENRQLGLIAAARAQAYDPERLAEAGRFDAAIARLDGAVWSMPQNPLTSPVIAELSAQRDDVVKAQVLAKRVAQVERAPATVAVSTAPVDDPIDDLWGDARADYLAGRLERSRDGLTEVLALDPSNRAARRLINQIVDELRTNPDAWRQQTRRSLISEVEQAWRRPGTAAPPSEETGYGAAGRNLLLEKLDAIEIPTVSFNAVELQRVVSTLSDLSREFDDGNGARKGVNIIVIDPFDRHGGILEFQPTIQ